MLAGGAANYGRKLATGEEMGPMDYVGAAADLTPPGVDDLLLKSLPALGMMGATAVAPKAARKLGEGGSLTGTVAPQRNIPRMRNPGRARTPPYPGIYGSERDIVANARVAPESENLGRVFNTSRGEMMERTQERMAANLAGEQNTGQIPDWAPDAVTGRGRGSEAAQAVTSPSNTQRLQDVLGLATQREDLAQGMIPWYFMDPAFERMSQLMGPEAAAAEYMRRETINSLMSPGSDVLTELNRGSRAAWLQKQGRFDEFLQYGGNPNQWIMQPGWNAPRQPFGLDPEMQGLLGHAYHSTSQAPVVGRYLETGSLGGADKVPSYTMAGRPSALGYQWDRPVGDAHFSRAIGLADVRPNKSYAQSATIPEMKVITPWWNEQIANPLGLQAVPAQALAWGTFGPQTGVQTAVGQPKLELMADAIAKTAHKTGMPIEKVRDMYLMGDMPIGNADIGLLGGMAGAGGLGALGYGYFGSE
jgi:hypothetical protein